MLRRKKLQSHGLGAFVDAKGSRKWSRVSGNADEDEDVVEKLEGLVFGRQPFRPSSPREREDHSSGESDKETEQAFSKDPGDLLQPRKPAWCDEDDEEISVDISSQRRLRKLQRSETETTLSGTAYSKRLQAQFEKLSAPPEWATRKPRKKRKRREEGHGSESSESGSSSEEEEEEERLLQRTGRLLAGRVTRLPQGFIDLKRMRDANCTKRAEAMVKAVEFHPSASVLLTAGFHKTLDLFQVDGQVNPKLQSVHVERFPIVSAHFTADGREVVMAGQRKYFFVYDMMAGQITRVHGIRGRAEKFFEKFAVSPDNEFLAFLGKDGYIPLVSNKTKQWVADLKMNGTVRDIAFTRDNRHLLSTGSDGKVYVWDLSTRDCVHCFTDEGCVLGTALAVSPDGRYVACGSDSGVVNVYDEQCFRRECPTPLKSLMNLTVGVDHAHINSTSELLAVTSRRKKSALKLVHLSSLTVFSNWPTPRSPLYYVSALDISPLSQYLAIGNDKGKVLLYRLNHFSKGL